MGYRAILNVLKAIAIFSLPLHLLNWSFSQNVVEKHFNSMVSLNISTKSPVNGAIKRETATGFIVCDDGHILTTAHIIPTHENDEYIDLSITGSIGRSEGYQNKISSSIRVDPHSDLMLLRFKGLPPSGIKPVEFADPDEVDIGADLYSLGYPFNEDLTPKFGQLANKTSEEGWATSLGFDPGDSGGPVFNDNDYVVAVARAGQGSLRYSIPIGHANNLLEYVSCDSSPPISTEPEVPESEIKAVIKTIVDREIELLGENIYRGLLDYFDELPEEEEDVTDILELTLKYGYEAMSKALGHYASYSGSNQCRNPRRYLNTLRVLEEVSKEEGNLQDLTNFISASSLNYDCVTSIMKDDFALLEIN